MNNTERVAALEALLGRIQKNASRPPVSWRAEGNGHLVEVSPEPAASPAPPPAAARVPAAAPSSPAKSPAAAQPAKPAAQPPAAAPPAAARSAQPPAAAAKPAAAPPAGRSALPSSPRVDPRAEPLGNWAEEGEGAARQTLPEDRAARLAALGRDSAVPAQKMKVTVPVGGRPAQGAGIKGFGSPSVQRPQPPTPAAPAAPFAPAVPAAGGTACTPAACASSSAIP